LFSPEHRDPAFWQSSANTTAHVHLLYVGAFRKRKTLMFWRKPTANYVTKDFHSAYLSATALFAGIARDNARGNLHRLFAGQRIAAAYASADVFVFPVPPTLLAMLSSSAGFGSAGDCSDTGGPKELVEENVKAWSRIARR